MTVETRTIQFHTRGNAEMTDITDQVREEIQKSAISNGTVTIFCPSSTTALTTIEYESGCIHDLERLYDQIVPQNQDYQHNKRWGDGNGHSHVRAALQGASFTVPISGNRLTLGTWQQIIHIDFDNRSRNRELILQVIGE